MDTLFSKLTHWGLGCQVGLTYSGAVWYADDNAVVF